MRYTNIIPLPDPVKADPYLINRARLTTQLLGHSLIDSFFRFISDGKPYPFVSVDQLLPSLGNAWIEHRHQNTVLMFLIDGTLPRPLKKHFRLRSSNRVTWRNIQRLAPDLDLSDFKASHCHLEDPGCDALLRRLLGLDYAILAQESVTGDGMILSHMHVKLERLTDTAIRELGKQLGYIDQRLFERGEDYVEALEGKFFEYFGFSANAAGRKSAAAMATQLLSAHSQRFMVFVAGQEDCRLTILDQGPLVEQYLLIQPDGSARQRFQQAAIAAGIKDLSNYALTGSSGSGSNDDAFPMLYRLRLERTAAARPGERQHRDRDLLKPWLRVKDAAVLPRLELAAPEIPFHWPELPED